MFNLSISSCDSDSTGSTFGATPAWGLWYATCNSGTVGPTFNLVTPSYADFTVRGQSTTHIPWPASWNRTERTTPQGTQEVYYDGTLTSGVDITLSTFFNPTQDVSVELVPDVTYTLGKGIIKFSLAIEGPNAGSALFGGDTSAQLEWSAAFSCSQLKGEFDIFDYDLIISEDGNVRTYLFNRTNGLAPVQVQIAMVVLVDGTVTQLPGYGLTTAEETSGGYSNLQVIIRWFFPYFEKSLVYDPNIGVLFGDGSGSDGGDGSDGVSSSGGGSGTSSGDGTNTELIEILVPVLCGVAILVVLAALVAAVVSAVYYRRRRSRMVRGLDHGTASFK